MSKLVPFPQNRTSNVIQACENRQIHFHKTQPHKTVRFEIRCITQNAYEYDRKTALRFDRLAETCSKRHELFLNGDMSPRKKNPGI